MNYDDTIMEFVTEQVQKQFPKSSWNLFYASRLSYNYTGTTVVCWEIKNRYLLTSEEFVASYCDGFVHSTTCPGCRGAMKIYEIANPAFPENLIQDIQVLIRKKRKEETAEIIVLLCVIVTSLFAIFN